MTDLHIQVDDATVVPPDKRADLIPSHVTLRSELNAPEQDNILAASVWALQRRHDPVSESFVRKLHRRMFRKVWRWAGKYRTTNTNLGVDRALVQPRLYEVLDNTRFWVENKTFPPDEIAVRFHHALVSIDRALLGAAAISATPDRCARDISIRLRPPTIRILRRYRFSLVHSKHFNLKSCRVTDTAFAPYLSPELVVA